MFESFFNRLSRVHIKKNFSTTPTGLNPSNLEVQSSDLGQTPNEWLFIERQPTTL